MPKINKKKYNFQEAIETMECPHCGNKESFKTKFHYEDVPKRIDGVLAIPLELVSSKVYDVSLPQLCQDCKVIPKCKDCEIILCSNPKHYASRKSPINKDYCFDCWDWKTKNSSYPQ